MFDLGADESAFITFFHTLHPGRDHETTSNSRPVEDVRTDIKLQKSTKKEYSVSRQISLQFDDRVVKIRVMVEKTLNIPSFALLGERELALKRTFITCDKPSQKKEWTQPTC